MYEYEYRRATSLVDASALLVEVEGARPLAGGMSLIPTMKHRLASPSRLVDLNAIPGLRYIDEASDRITIGAMTLHETVAESAEVKRRLPALAKLAAGIGDVQVRHRGTIGGSVSNNDPGACYPSALLGLGAIVQTTHRQIEANDFFVGLFATPLQPGEIVTKIEFPVPDAAAYVKFHNLASRFSIVGVFVARFGQQVRVAVTGAGSCVFRATDLEERLSDSFSTGVLDGVVISPDGLTSDVHGPAEYRAHLIPVLAERAVQQCLEAL
jgi:carbon-monoxide dehydrogenase medium subunit